MTLQRTASATVALIAAASLLVSLAPAGLGHHLSVGAEDTVGMAPAEPPADTTDQLYERGTSTDCTDPNATDPGTATADGFCGELVYNQGTGFETLSPRDQVSDHDVRIDLQKATYVGLYGTSSCSPWCNMPGAYEGLHDVGADLGLTPPSDEVDDGGEQTYGGHVFAPSPTQVYQAAGQSWLLPVTDTSFVAFVTGPNGETVDEERLSELVTSAKGDGLDHRAREQVCAFTPNAQIGQHAADAGRCEVELDWMGEEEGRNDPCQADTYVCGASQPVWRGTTMCPMWHAACYLSDAWNSAHHFAVWHGVVAPSPPPKCGATEPGFDTHRSTFLAHDLDIHEPPSDETPAKGVPNAWDEVGANVPGVGPLREGNAPSIADTPAGHQVQATPAFAQAEPEPNHEQGWLGLEESSQERSEERTLDECAQLATGETDVDPWVNIVDAQVTREVAGFGTPAGGEPAPDHEPKPSMQITGKVGVFADVDDDGRYDQAPSSEVFAVEEHGAYPILWDHHERGDGCQFRSGKTMGDITTEAGYAHPTGLAITVRLSDGALVDTRNGEVRPVVQPTAVGMLSEGLDPDDAVVEEVLEKAAGERPQMVLEDAFEPQCGEPTGGFTAAYEIVGEPMAGDGVAAAAITTVEEGAPGGADEAVPASPIELSGTNVWWDLDPFEPRDVPAS